MNDKESRVKILSFLQKEERNDPGRLVAKKYLVEKLNMDNKTLDYHMNYLKDKGYVKVDRYVGGEFDCRITSLGSDKIAKG